MSLVVPWRFPPFVETAVILIQFCKATKIRDDDDNESIILVLIARIRTLYPSDVTRRAGNTEA